MKHLVRAGLMALGLLASTPSFATEGCRPLEAVLSDVQTVSAVGVRAAMFPGDQAKAAMAAIIKAFGEPPREIKPDLVILLIGPEGALVLFAEGIDVCLQLPIARSKAEALERAVLGEPA